MRQSIKDRLSSIEYIIRGQEGSLLSEQTMISIADMIRRRDSLEPGFPCEEEFEKLMEKLRQ